MPHRVNRLKLLVMRNPKTESASKRSERRQDEHAEAVSAARYRLRQMDVCSSCSELICLHDLDQASRCGTALADWVANKERKIAERGKI